MKRVSLVLTFHPEFLLVLAVTRGRNMHSFSLPGGHVDPGETSPQAALRELYEETGVVPSGLQEVFRDRTKGKEVVTYAAPVVYGQLRPSHEGVPMWVDPELLVTSSPFAGYHRKVFRAVGM